jgi:DNA/RNA-binding domain of Phe-tRNA-synthetase-like protein
LPDDPAIHFAPGLACCTFAVERNPQRRSPPTLRRRLNALSDRHGGARAITQRTREIPQAYRAHYGVERSPAEELTIERLIRGQYRSRGVLRDALLIATMDTEVGVYALDAGRIAGEPRLAGREIVDDDGPLAPLFVDPGAARGPFWRRPPRDARQVAVTRATRRITLFAITAPGIADLATEEALLSAYEVIASA